MPKSTLLLSGVLSIAEAPITATPAIIITTPKESTAEAISTTIDVALTAPVSVSHLQWSSNFQLLKDENHVVSYSSCSAGSKDKPSSS